MKGQWHWEATAFWVLVLLQGLIVLFKLVGIVHTSWVQILFPGLCFFALFVVTLVVLVVQDRNYDRWLEKERRKRSL